MPQEFADIQVPPGQNAEFAELQAVLASPLFARAPSLSQLLTFLCRKYFAGESASLSEQQIAVEALRRPESFDQKRDSIVRVELHRLRKRLALYYQGEGTGNAIEISIPAGGYSPRFTVRTPAIDPAASSDSPPPPSPPARRGFNWRALAARLGLFARL